MDKVTLEKVFDEQAMNVLEALRDQGMDATEAGRVLRGMGEMSEDAVFTQFYTNFIQPGGDYGAMQALLNGWFNAARQ
jgi:hypothetical protein